MQATRRLQLFLLAFITLTAATAAAVDFPGRQESRYKHLKTIEIDTLHKDYQAHKAVIIDVRSRLEFDTIHIKDANHISLSDKRFKDKLRNLATGAQGKKIAFYRNGTTCFKAYEAQLKAIGAGVKNTYTFDLGIPGWAEQYPQDTILLGTPIPESSVKFIPKSEFKAKTLKWEEFKKRPPCPVRS